MARFRKPSRAPAISNFTRVPSNAGAGFRLLAEAMGEAYELVTPVAEEQLEREGTEAGLAAAKSQLGVGRPYARGYGDDIDAFNASLAQTESGGSYTVRNELGFSGKYQFGQERLDDFNRANGTNYSTDDLISGTPESRQLSEFVQRWHVNDIDRDLGDLVGKEVAGIPMTKNAIRAMAHLGGKGGARQFVESGGAYDPADANGTRLSDYAQIHGATSKSVDPVVIRNDKGQLETRRFSPYAGPLLQVYDNAAQVAYRSQVLNKASVDIMDISRQHPMDPEGFSEAMGSYIDSIVEQAPTDFQVELRQALTEETQRRQFALEDSRQQNIERTARNEGKALIERWSANLTEAIVTGNEEEITAAQDKLEGILDAYGTLPGTAWGDAQSANVILDARRRAEAAKAKQQTAFATETKGTFRDILKAAKNGMTHEDEGLLQDPDAVAADPDGAREAAAFVSLRDTQPELLTMTPDQLDQVVENMKSENVEEDWQIDLVNAVSSLARDSRKAWDDDPIKQAETALKTNPPPAMPDLNNIEGAADMFAARREYVEGLVEEGYIDEPVFLSGDEADILSEVMSLNTPADIRAAVAGTLAQGFGADVMTVLSQIDGDRATLHAGKMIAAGNPQVATMIMEGQEVLEQNLVTLPTKTERLDTFNPGFASAFSGIPNSLDAQRDVLEAAQAIYAANPAARGLEPTSESAEALFEEAVQQALGQSTNTRGRKTGGMQLINGYQTLLPMGVSGRDVNKALQKAFYGEAASGGGVALGGFTFSQDVEWAFPVWEEMERGMPLHNGKPITRNAIDDIRVISVGPAGYRMEYVSGTTSTPLLDEDGNYYMFDMDELLEAAK